MAQSEVYTRLTPSAQQTSGNQLPGRVLFVYMMWIFVWYEPDWFVESLGGGVVLVKFYALMFIPVALLLLTHLRREALFWPFLLVIAIHVIWMPFVLNRGFLTNAFMKVVQYPVLAILTISIIETPQQIVPLIKLFLGQFIWYGLQGLPAAGVVWHQNLANTDSFGPFMTIGFGFAYYLAMGTSSKKYRYLALFICALGLIGTLLSFARGAFIALCVVFAVIVIRMPRKTAVLAYGALFVAIGLIAIKVAFPHGEFWDEMGTITEEGASEGTGLQRWVMWQIAGELFLMYPILGVGPGNFGPNAVEYLTEQGVTDMGSSFNSRGKLYMMALHNDFVQVMVEQGIIGLIALLAMLIYFNSIVRLLRAEPIKRIWQEQTAGFIDSAYLALALEVSMVGYLVNAIFYNQFYSNWIWSILMFALVARSLTKRAMLSLVESPVYTDARHGKAGAWSVSGRRELHVK